jgi:ferredoxin
MAGVARSELRRVFAEADVGITGANALIAETGTVMLITNEGNGRLTSSLPPVHVVLAGWEKLVPTFADAAAQVRLLARSGTGQDVTVYTTFITGPDRPDRELHVVIVDNGRSTMAAEREFSSALRCIRCAACADVCPPYQVVGGQVFGYIYSGAIGLVNTAFHHGLEAAAGPQSLCVQCGACATVCPVGIPLPRQILDIRSRVTEGLGLPHHKRLALAVWARPALFAAGLGVARLAQRPFRRGKLLRMPLPKALGWRRVPALAPRPARETLLGREFSPRTRGRLADSNARGLKVAYFIQCITDQFAPEQAVATVEVSLLRAAGARLGGAGAGEDDGSSDHRDAGGDRGGLDRDGRGELRGRHRPRLPASVPRRARLAPAGRGTLRAHARLSQFPRAGGATPGWAAGWERRRGDARTQRRGDGDLP